ncbi:MAG: hypothetical protein SchgKO_12550 [Schleiferiaceae bacterium]
MRFSLFKNRTLWILLLVFGTCVEAFSQDLEGCYSTEHEEICFEGDTVRMIFILWDPGYPRFGTTRKAKGPYQRKGGFVIIDFETLTFFDDSSLVADCNISCTEENVGEVIVTDGEEALPTAVVVLYNSQNEIIGAVDTDIEGKTHVSDSISHYVDSIGIFRMGMVDMGVRYQRDKGYHVKMCNDIYFSNDHQTGQLIYHLSDISEEGFTLREIDYFSDSRPVDSGFMARMRFLYVMTTQSTYYHKRKEE